MAKDQEPPIGPMDSFVTRRAAPAPAAAAGAPLRAPTPRAGGRGRSAGRGRSRSGRGRATSLPAPSPLEPWQQYFARNIAQFVGSKPPTARLGGAGESDENKCLRRLDSLAKLFAGESGCSAVYFDPNRNQFAVGSNSDKNKDLIDGYISYFKTLAEHRMTSGVLTKAQLAAWRNTDPQESIRRLLLKGSIRTNPDLRFTAAGDPKLMEQLGEGSAFDPFSYMPKVRGQDATDTTPANRLPNSLRRAFEKIEDSFRTDGARYKFPPEMLAAFQRGQIIRIQGEPRGTHAEMAVVGYILKPPLVAAAAAVVPSAAMPATPEKLIGISKLCCAHCALALKAVNDVKTAEPGLRWGRLKTRGTHGNIYDWIMPNFLAQSRELLRQFIGADVGAGVARSFIQDKDLIRAAVACVAPTKASRGGSKAARTTRTAAPSSELSHSASAVGTSAALPIHIPSAHPLGSAGAHPTGLSTHHSPPLDTTHGGLAAPPTHLAPSSGGADDILGGDSPEARHPSARATRASLGKRSRASRSSSGNAASESQEVVESSGESGSEDEESSMSRRLTAAATAAAASAGATLSTGGVAGGEDARPHTSRSPRSTPTRRQGGATRDVGE